MSCILPYKQFQLRQRQGREEELNADHSQDSGKSKLRPRRYSDTYYYKRHVKAASEKIRGGLSILNKSEPLVITAATAHTDSCPSPRSSISASTTGSNRQSLLCQERFGPPEIDTSIECNHGTNTHTTTNNASSNTDTNNNNNNNNNNSIVERSTASSYYTRGCSDSTDLHDVTTREIGKYILELQTAEQAQVERAQEMLRMATGNAERLKVLMGKLTNMYFNPNMDEETPHDEASLTSRQALHQIQQDLDEIQKTKLQQQSQLIQHSQALAAFVGLGFESICTSKSANRENNAETTVNWLQGHVLESVQVLAAAPSSSLSQERDASYASTNTEQTLFVQEQHHHHHQQQQQQRRHLLCPLSNAIMEDPVVLVPSGVSYDRKWLCQALLEGPNVEPSMSTIQENEPFEYYPNLNLRHQLETMGYPYVPFNDTGFREAYMRAWDKQILKDYSIDAEEVTATSQTSTVSHTSISLAPSSDPLISGGHLQQEQQQRQEQRQQEEEVYSEISALLNGMNTRVIDLPKALQIAQSSGTDPILLAMQANLHRITGQAEKGKTLWDASHENGLLSAAHAGNRWAQYLVGLSFDLGRGGVSQNYEMAERWYKKAAAQDDSDAQCNLGYLFELGLIGDKVKDFEAARRCYEKAANQGNASAQFNLGALYSKGHVGKRGKDYNAARMFYERAAAQGHARATLSLGFLYECGLIGDRGKDYETAQLWYEKASAMGDSDAQCNLGYLYQYGRVGARIDGPTVEVVEQEHEESVSRCQAHPDYQMAFYWYKLAASKGHPRAQFALGLLYHEGYLGDQQQPDYQRAQEWYEKSATQGHLKSQRNLGILFKEGRIGCKDNRPDYSAAQHWFERAASQGDGISQIEMGELCAKGHVCTGKTGNCEAAREWYGRAAASGNADALNKLGVLFATGKVGEVEIDYEIARQYYEEAVTKGHAKACLNLGLLYENGNVGELGRDYQSAQLYYEKAAALGDAEGQYSLGRLYQHGFIGSKNGKLDYHLAQSWYEKAASNGHTKAQLHLGLLYERGEIGENGNDYESARHWYEKAAMQNLAVAQRKLGDLYKDGHVGGSVDGNDYEQACRWYESAVEHGDTEAQYSLAGLYMSGYIGATGQNYGAAQTLYEGAAERGHLNAQYTLGVLHANGFTEDKKRNYAKACEWYKIAAENGSAVAQRSLGTLYRDGLVGEVGSDYKEAQFWYEKAASQEDAVALLNLGAMHVNGHIDGEKNYEKARELFQRAGLQGNANAHNNLGVLYAKGLIGSVGKDYQAARLCYEQAVALGDPVGHFNLGLLHENGKLGNGKDFKTALIFYKKAAEKGHEGAKLALERIMGDGEATTEPN